MRSKSMGRTSLVALAATLGLGAVSSVAIAGSGTVVPGGPDPTNCDDPRTSTVEACDGRRPGDVSLAFAFMFPPSQADADDAALALTRANRILCDATDGQLRLKNVRWIVGDDQAAAADIRWYYNSSLVSRSLASGVAVLGVPGQHVALMENTIEGDVVAHELGHYLLGLHESYAEDDRALGSGFDGQRVNGFAWARGPFDLFNRVLPSFPDAERNNSIMQQSNSYYCSNAAGWTPSQVDPIFSGNRDGDPCRTDADCTQAPFLFCPAVPSVMSELSVAASFDALTGPGTPPAAVRESRELVFSGFLPTTPCAGEQDGRFVGSADNFEECTSPGATFTSGSGTSVCTTTCRETCLMDLTDCAEGPPVTCGDGVVNAGSGEQCDGDAPQPCSSLRTWLTGGTATCGPDCRWDRSACQIVPPGLAGLARSFSESIELMDSLGDIATDGALDVRVFQRPEPHSWTVRVMWGAALSYAALAVYKLDFDTEGNLVAVNGLRPPGAGGTDPSPQLVIGADADPPGMTTTYGDVDLGDVTGGGQVLHTGAFSNGAPPLVLDLRFENLREQDAVDAFGAALTQNNGFMAHARHGVVSGGPHDGREIPAGIGGCPYSPTSTGYDWCEMGWNDTTQRFETTAEANMQLNVAWNDEASATLTWQQFKDAVAAGGTGPGRPYVRSEWERIGRILLASYGVTVDVPELASAEFDAAECPDPVFEPAILTVSEPQRIILALDKSGSMAGPLTWAGLEDLTRLEFAKAAAQMFISRQLGRATPPDVGLVWYDAHAEASSGFAPSEGLFPLADAEPRTLISGSVDASASTDEAVEAAVQASGSVGRDDLARFMATGRGTLPENPVAGGMTAIGDVLQFAGGLLPETSPSTQAIVLLSDGEETALPNGLTTVDPVAEAAKLRARGVQVYSLALGFEAGGITLSEVAAQSAGPIWSVRDPRELPGTFFEAYARQQGEALVRNIRTGVTSSSSGEEFPSFYFSQGIPVESGAHRLVVLLSLNQGGVANWPLDAKLADPSGQQVTPQIVEGPYYQLLTVNSPAAGEWSVQWMQGYGTVTQPVSLVSAHVENPRPDCFAGFNNPVIAEGGRIELAVSPEFDGFNVTEGATITATVRRPDYSTVELEVPYDQFQERYAVQFPSAELRGRGAYEAVVRCTVADGAEVAAGEGKGHSQPPPDLDVVGFEREATASFFYDTAELPPLPGPGTPFAGDCDGDGIPNAAEPDGDADGDGAPNVCDGDADGDDVPDAIDPDPTTPHQGCVALPPTLGCCTSLAECLGGGFALYADGELRLADRTTVMEPDGSPAMVANAGGLQTNIGVSDALGHLYSVAPVILRENATIDGSVWTAGTIEEQNGVTVTGRRWTGSALTFPALDTFTYEFATASTSPVQLEPGQSLELPPGSYGAIDVKTDAVLHLHPGMYEIASLMVQPGGHLDVDTAAGPLHVYARGGIVVRGMLPGSADPGQLLFASFGPQDVIIEAPFKGTVVAPVAKVIVTGGTHQGSFFARTLQVNPDALIEHYPFAGGWPHTAPGPCSNQVQDGTETDVDCGGGTCGPCSLGEACVVVSDCVSGACAGGVCAGSGSVTATLNLTSSWDAGYCAEVTVTNTGTQPTSGWEVGLDLHDSAATTWWNGDVTASGAEAMVRALDYNRVIWQASSTTFGFCANKLGANFTPTVTGATGD